MSHGSLAQKKFWVGPGDQIWPDQRIKYKLKLVYMYGAGFYTYSIFALQFWEIRENTKQHQMDWRELHQSQTSNH
ncbi:hypothetical protein GUJ93_ZPchr0012g19885 [Zizania palustris]|uniref:Uncharacterized protein n=1 Tax=Zizania palustris TaxID=103762 RepID=A0A8J5WRP2_ZIZPA|nr:hypothetical protein GUJ93_ZPchr0012g19885 [Zizania palustris]